MTKTEDETETGPNLTAKKIMVTGASGKIGRATVTALSEAVARGGDFTVLAGIRDEYGEKALEIGKLEGVTVDEALPSVPQSVVRCAQGADAAFIVTPPTEDRVELVKATADALKEAGVKFILVLSMPIADKPTSTVFGGQFCKIETALKGCLLPVCVLRVPFLMENFTLSAALETLRTDSCIEGAVCPTAPWTMTCARDVGVMAAAILQDPCRHSGKTYTLASPASTYESVAADISAALGRPVLYNNLAYTKMKYQLLDQGTPEWTVKGLLEAWHLIDEACPLMDQRENTDFVEVTSLRPTSFASWVNQNKSTFA